MPIHGTLGGFGEALDTPPNSPFKPITSSRNARSSCKISSIVLGFPKGGSHLGYSRLISSTKNVDDWAINIEEEHSIVAPFNRTLFKHVSQLWRPGVLKDKINQETQT
jgi:hypothetical protein